MDLDEPVTAVINVPVALLDEPPLSGVPQPEACPACGSEMLSGVTSDEHRIQLAWLCDRLHVIPAWEPGSLHGEATAQALRRLEERLSRKSAMSEDLSPAEAAWLRWAHEKADPLGVSASQVAGRSAFLAGYAAAVADAAAEAAGESTLGPSWVVELIERAQRSEFSTLREYLERYLDLDRHLDEYGIPRASNE